MEKIGNGNQDEIGGKSHDDFSFAERPDGSIDDDVLLGKRRPHRPRRPEPPMPEYPSVEEYEANPDAYEIPPEEYFLEVVYPPSIYGSPPSRQEPAPQREPEDISEEDYLDVLYPPELYGPRPADGSPPTLLPPDERPGPRT